MKIGIAIASSLFFFPLSAVSQCSETCSLETDGRRPQLRPQGSHIYKIGRDGVCEEKCSRAPRASLLIGWECGYCSNEGLATEIDFDEAIAISGNATRAFFVEPADDDRVVSCTLTGGSMGDADLYLKYDEQPSFDSFDCRSFNVGSNEYCVLDALSTIYVLVNPFLAVDEVELTCIRGVAPTLAPTPTPAPTNAPTFDEADVAKTQTIATMADDEVVELTVDISGRSSITCNLACDAGDADLYIAEGRSATPSDNDCSGTNFECFESCTIELSGNEDTLYVSVYAFDDMKDVNLVCGGSS